MKAIYIMNANSFDLVYPQSVRDEIEKLAEIDVQPLTTAQLKEDYTVLKDVEAIFSGWGGPQIDQTVLDHAPHLKVIFYAAGSIKKIATDEMWDRGIVITTAAKANAVPVIEFTLSQILFSLKNGWQYVREIRTTKNYPSKPFDIRGTFGSTVGIISLSTIGRGVCDLLKHFDINVIAYDPFASKEDAEKLGAELCSLEDVFEKADIVSLHTPLLDATRGMITGEHFRKMKTNTTFINTARGAIVKEEEMIEVLQQRPDITAILDVTYPEPPEKASPLYEMPNVVLTPHLAGSQGDELARMGDYMLQEVKRYINGEPLKWQVSREVFKTQA